MRVLNSVAGKSTSKKLSVPCESLRENKIPNIATLTILQKPRPCFTAQKEEESQHPSMFPQALIRGGTWKWVDFLFPFPLPVKWSVEKLKPRTTAEPMQGRKCQAKENFLCLFPPRNTFTTYRKSQSN